jgi:hypothetical protein
MNRLIHNSTEPYTGAPNTGVDTRDVAAAVAAAAGVGDCAVVAGEEGIMASGHEFDS